MDVRRFRARTRVTRRARIGIGGGAFPLAVAALAAPLWLAPPARACDSTACLLQTRGGNGVPSRGDWTVDLSFRYTDQSVGMDGGRRIAQVRRPWVDFERQTIWPQFHSEDAGVERFLQADAVFGIGWQSALQVSLPLYSRRSYSIVHGSDGFRYQTEGTGDAVIGFRRAVGRVVTGIAFKLPSGRSDVLDPFGVYILDPMIQPGTGSYDASLSSQVGFRAMGLDGTLSGSYQYNRPNGREYQFGADVIGGASVRRRLAGPVSASLQVKGVHKFRSTFLGEAVPSTGGLVVYVNPGVQVSLPRSGTAYVYAPLPTYRHVNEQQLTPRFSLLVGLSKAF